MGSNTIFLNKSKTRIFLSAFLAFFPISLFAQENERLIKEYILKNKISEFKKADLTHFKIDNTDFSQSLNGQVIKIQQTFKGIPVYNSLATAFIKDRKITYFNDSFVKSFTSSSDVVTISPKNALEKIAASFSRNEISDYIILNDSDKEPDHKNFAKQNFVYILSGSDLRLSHQFLFHDPENSKYWNVLVDASSGEIISKENLTLECHFHKDAYSHDSTHPNIIIENSMEKLPSTFLADNANYNVFPLPTEAPTFGSRTLVSNPWILSSSPEGWHSTGTEKYTVTRGNNVYAYEDRNDKDQPGYSPDGGSSLSFNFPFSINGTPDFNQNAAITNLFYTANRVHDIFYQFGFTESARNFQQNNFGKGGIGNDYLLAESQDGGGLNNANFTTPSDGKKPVMQMYLWSRVNRYFYYNAPVSAIPRVPQASAAQFGPQLNGIGVTGDVMLANVIDGCTPLTPNSLAGKIGLIERGGGTNCTFALKVKNAQDAGAVAAIIYNNPGAVNFPASMGGTDASITIPSVLINNAEGEYIKTQLSNLITVNVTLKSDPATAVTPDGSFDNGIIIHEYGHGITNRLTGNGFSCLSKVQSKEQMGEGWSDFFALMLTNTPNADASVPRSIGSYASGQSASGLGFRPAKYSPDFSVNDYTYADTNGMEFEEDGELVPDVHRIGFVWGSMLWDLHWQYAAKYGYSSDVTANKNSGSARVLQLVTDALKLQTCNPTFIDGRNAVLNAEMFTTGGENRCMIWKTFAKRGLGLNASAGSKTNINDQVEDFSVPADCREGNANAAIDRSLIKIYPNPAKDEFFIYLKDNTIGKLFVQMYDMSGKLVLSEDRFSPDARIPVSTKDIENGVYVVSVQGIGVDFRTKIIIKK